MRMGRWERDQSGPRKVDPYGTLPATDGPVRRGSSCVPAFVTTAAATGCAVPLLVPLLQAAMPERAAPGNPIRQAPSGALILMANLPAAALPNLAMLI